MPKTFDGIQAMAYLKQGYAVRRAEWLEPRHIHRGRAGGVICETGNSQPLHLDELFEGDWEFYCNPTAEGMEPTHGTWEWAKVAMEQGKKVRKCVWRPTSYLEMRGDDLWGSVGKSCANFEEYREWGPYGWEEYIEPQAPKKGMTWEEARALLSPGVAVRRRAWVGLRPPKYVSHHVTTIICDEDEAATDWEVVTNPPGKSTGMTWKEARVAMAQGKSVRRPGWSNEYARVHWPMNDGAKGAKIDTYDIKATDWEVVK